MRAVGEITNFLPHRVGEITNRVDAVGEITILIAMVGEITNQHPERSPLLPDRTGQGDFFVCDIFDAAPKGDMASMEHPIFSLSTKPDRRVRRYEQERTGLFIEITPSVKGLATVHDRDVLIYCISQLIAALNEGKRVSKTVRLKAYDLLRATNRVSDGRGYEGLKAAFERLRGTTISTNIVTGGAEQFDVFGIIDRARIVRETREGRMQEVEITLSDWVFNAIEANEVLTLHRDYFRLRKPLERRIYELARKHCGMQSEWKISLRLLQKKCGSISTDKEFRRLVSTIVRHDETYDHMPDYSVRMEGDMVVFQRRAAMICGAKGDDHQLALPMVDAETFAAARKVAPGYDVHFLYDEWQKFARKEGRPIKHPEKAFLGFCRERHKRAPLA